jgi:arylsulfatase
MPPNILFITADHLRYDTIGCHGDPAIRTPAIDALARDGVDFNNYFSQNPVCQPSRATMMTGRYPRHHGVRWNGNRIDANEMTLVEFLKGRGYATASIGKHHISQDRFDAAVDHFDADHIRRNWKERPDGDYTVRDPNPFERYVRSRGHEYATGYALPEFRERLGAVPSDLPEDCHLDAYVGMRTREYLERVDGSQPFFLWMGFYGPHHPYVPSGRFAHMYDPDEVPPFHRADDDIELKPPEYGLYFQEPTHKYHGFANASERTFREMKAAYYGMVSQLDWQLGLTLDALRERGLAENTIVVFTCDHGEFLGDHGIPAKAPFLLDCMLHVPCIVSGPGIGSGQTRAELIESVDLFPTIARLAGYEAPEWVQGRDVTPLLGEEAADFAPREAIYAEAVDKRCVRTGEWKYIHYPGKPYGELYHVSEDPHELRNLWDEEPTVRQRMRDLYYRILDETEDTRHPKYQRFGGIDPETGKEITHYLTW